MAGAVDQPAHLGDAPLLRLGQMFDRIDPDAELEEMDRHDGGSLTHRPANS